MDLRLHFPALGAQPFERVFGAGARQYAVNGERRGFALLRPIAEAAAQERVRDLVLDAFAEYEASAERS